MRSAALNICVGLAAGTLLMAARPAEAINVTIEGLPATVMAGDMFDFDVVVSDIGDSNDIISAWDIDVAYDPTAVEYADTTFDPAPWGGNLDDAIYDAFDDQNGLVDVWLVSLLSDLELLVAQCPGAPFDCGPTVTLATLSFTALTDGEPMISLVDWGPWNDIKCADNRQCYPTGEVPEPGTLALLGLGLLGLGLGRRRAV